MQKSQKQKNNKRQKNNLPKKVKQDYGSLQVSITHPPPIEDFEVRHSQCIRYTVGTAVLQAAITFQNLLDTICFATTAIAPFNVFRTVKVRAIEVWALPAIATSTSVNVTFSGPTAGLVGDFRSHSDTSMGLQPAHLRVKPVVKALCSDYQVSSNNTAFSVSLPVGSVIDVHLSFRGSCNSETLAAQNASAGATVGSTFWRSLDGRATATAQFLLPLGIAQF